MEFLANNWDMIMTILNTVGLVIMQKTKAKKVK